MDLGLSSLLGGGISAISGLFGGISQNKTNLKIARETNLAQMELAKYQAEQNYKLWQENNAYNDPSAQMERYRIAGLNPNLIYGNGSSSAGNSSSPAEGYNAPTLQRAQVDNSYMASSSQALMNGIQQAMQIKKTQAETNAIYQNVENLKVDNEYKHVQVAFQHLLNSKTRDEANVWKDILQARKANLLGGAHQSESNALTNDLLRPQLVAFKSAQIENIALQNKDLSYQLNQLRPAQRQEIIQRIASLAAQADLYRANTLLSESNISLNADRSENLWQDTMLKRSQEFATSLENQIREVLINNGVNLRGDAVERLLNQLLPDSGFGTAVKGALSVGARWLNIK